MYASVRKGADLKAKQKNGGYGQFSNPAMDIKGV